MWYKSCRQLFFRMINCSLQICKLYICMYFDYNQSRIFWLSANFGWKYIPKYNIEELMFPLKNFHAEPRIMDMLIICQLSQLLIFVAPNLTKIISLWNCLCFKLAFFLFHSEYKLSHITIATILHTSIYKILKLHQKPSICLSLYWKWIAI